jgi:ankyrin repeat protein
LLRYGAEIDAQNKKGWNALYYACFHRKTNIVSLLLKHGTNVNIQTDTGENALQNASYNGDMEIIHLLLQHNVLLHLQNKLKTTALHRAVQKKHVKVVKLLLEHNACPNVQGKYRWTPLHWASNQGCPEIVALLLRYGADKRLTTDRYKTPFALACSKHSLDKVFKKEQGGKKCIALLSPVTVKTMSLEYMCMRRAVILGLDTSLLYPAAKEFLKKEFGYPYE